MNQKQAIQAKQIQPAKSMTELHSRLENTVNKFKKVPAKSMPELQTRLEYLIMQFPVEARKGIVINPANSKMTGENLNDGYLYSNCGGSSSADGKPCDCKNCKYKNEHSNFVTNYREGGLQSADGTTGRVDETKVQKWKSGAMTVLILGSVFVIGALLIGQGEKARAY